MDGNVLPFTQISSIFRDFSCRTRKQCVRFVSYVYMRQKAVYGGFSCVPTMSVSVSTSIISTMSPGAQVFGGRDDDGSFLPRGVG